jgi:hypothetical protein
VQGRRGTQLVLREAEGRQWRTAGPRFQHLTQGGYVISSLPTTTAAIVVGPDLVGADVEPLQARPKAPLIQGLCQGKASLVSEMIVPQIEGAHRLEKFALLRGEAPQSKDDLRGELGGGQVQDAEGFAKWEVIRDEVLDDGHGQLLRGPEERQAVHDQVGAIYVLGGAQPPGCRAAEARRATSAGHR